MIKMLLKKKRFFSLFHCKIAGICSPSHFISRMTACCSHPAEHHCSAAQCCSGAHSGSGSGRICTCASLHFTRLWNKMRMAFIMVLLIWLCATRSMCMYRSLENFVEKERKLGVGGWIMIDFFFVFWPWDEPL